MTIGISAKIRLKIPSTTRFSRTPGGRGFYDGNLMMRGSPCWFVCSLLRCSTRIRTKPQRMSIRKGHQSVYRENDLLADILSKNPANTLLFSRIAGSINQSLTARGVGFKFKSNFMKSYIDYLITVTSPPPHWMTLTEDGRYINPLSKLQNCWVAIPLRTSENTCNFCSKRRKKISVEATSTFRRFIERKNATHSYEIQGDSGIRIRQLQEWIPFNPGNISYYCFLKYRADYCDGRSFTYCEN